MPTETIHMNKNRGIGLVELLVAIGLSSIVSLAIIQLFIQNKTSYVAHENITRLQENGRYAIQLMTRSIRSSDYWGCVPVRDGQLLFPDNPPANPGPNDYRIQPVIFNIADDLGNPPNFVSSINGDEGNAEAGRDDGFPSAPDTIRFSGLISTRAYPLVENFEVPSNADIQIDLGASNNPNIAPNEILVISNCEQATVFQVTNNVAGTVAAGADGNFTATVAHTTTPFPGDVEPLFSNISDTITGVTSYEAGKAALYRNTLINAQYSIANDDHDGDPSTPEIPTLMRDLGDGPQPIVPGVENLQVVYGEDLDDDNQADRYVDADDVADWEEVISVRLSILMRSPDDRSETAVGYTMEGVQVNAANIQPNANGDFPIRRVFTTTVALRNRTT